MANGGAVDKVAAFLAAAELGDDSKVASAMDHDGIDPSSSDSAGNCALHKAAVKGHEAVVDILVSRRCDLDKPNNFGCTALYLACKAGRAGVVDRLIKAGADAARPTHSGATPLFVAAFDGFVDVLELLLHADGTSVDAPTKDGKTPFMIAASNGHWPAAKLLLAHGANINAADCEGATALHYMAGIDNDDVACMAALLAAGAALEVADGQGRTPLFRACQRESCVRAQALIDAGARVNVQDATGATPLHVAAEMALDDTLQVLIGAGALRGVRDSAGRLPVNVLPTTLKRQQLQQLRSLLRADLDSTAALPTVAGGVGSLAPPAAASPAPAPATPRTTAPTASRGSGDGGAASADGGGVGSVVGTSSTGGSLTVHASSGSASGPGLFATRAAEFPTTVMAAAAAAGGLARAPAHDYTRLKLLGEGAFGSTHLATCPGRADPVVVKDIKQPLGDRDKALRETTVLKQVTGTMAVVPNQVAGRLLACSQIAPSLLVESARRSTGTPTWCTCWTTGWTTPTACTL